MRFNRQWRRKLTAAGNGPKAEWVGALMGWVQKKNKRKGKWKSNWAARSIRMKGIRLHMENSNSLCNTSFQQICLEFKV
jgi:hypothetical protein